MTPTNTLNLRPYQEKFLEDINAKMADHNAVIAIAPVGGGKTRSLAAFVLGLKDSSREDNNRGDNNRGDNNRGDNNRGDNNRGDNNRVLVLTSMISTLQQINERFIDYDAKFVSHCASSCKRIVPEKTSQIVTGTVQTISHYLKKDPNCLGEFSHIITDHDGIKAKYGYENYYRVITEIFPNAKFIMFTNFPSVISGNSQVNMELV